ncbi:MAG: hypothetical protein JRE57_00130 [Deltaproteobacteria bacterium]|nr:hypothetical protein [Deltaproteobacteria bacterium]
MATSDQVKDAIGCLSTVFPQFVAKELAGLVDDITSAVQGFTDPLAAAADLNIDSLVDDVAAISEGDIFGNLGSAAVGLGAQYTGRELSSMVSAQISDGTNISKRVNQIQQMAEGVINSAAAMMSIYSDMPYAVAQKICETIIGLNNLKIANLQCLRKHIVQLVNAVVVLGSNVSTYANDVFDDLEAVKSLLGDADLDLTKSIRLNSSGLSFDANAFDRARTAIEQAGLLMAPSNGDTSILDAVSLIGFGSADTDQVDLANQRLVLIVIPSLTNLIEAEVAAFVGQVEVVNFHIAALIAVIDQYRGIGTASRVQEQRIRLIRDIQSRLVNLDERITLAIDRRSLQAASAEMLLWSSRIKSVLVMMDRVSQLTLTEGSVEGDGKAFALQQAFTALVTGLSAINNDTTDSGVEDPVVLQSQVLAITKAVKRIVKDIEEGRATESRIQNLHTLTSSAALSQISNLEDSISVAVRQNSLCKEFADIELATRATFDGLLDSMRQLKLDRGVALLSTGSFEDFFAANLDELSFLGAAANCLTDALDGIDDVQTRQQILDIRDGMVADRANAEIAAADSADQGRTRFIDNAKESIATIQRNAKTVEAIVTDLSNLFESLGGSLSDVGTSLTAFLSDLDHLAVEAGGRLADGLEEFSDHPNAGVVTCEL